MPAITANAAIVPPVTAAMKVHIRSVRFRLASTKVNPSGLSSTKAAIPLVTHGERDQKDSQEGKGRGHRTLRNGARRRLFHQKLQLFDHRPDLRDLLA